ncbi:MAG: hypothetical protein RM049_07675 [Nostoc sp. DedQUE04]|uniref:hypothetical protein n=1 Tax=Nostoc sp. DedQUE04 TaxID=3075390 RepID=UPI002AD35846|nr:hypothetical protein [Nostoc sp. DedQUE04]MDZ8135170.1 hypothetical protein [Nostoc sp. DedQUE04]
MNVTEIITYIEQNFNRTQAIGLNSLIFLSLREDTSVGYQWKSWGFVDIPKQVIDWCGCMDEHDLIELATAIANCLIDGIIPTAVEPANAQIIAMQAIDKQKQPSLLSDY